MSRRKPGAFIAVIGKERNFIIRSVKFAVILANIDITMTILTNSVVFLRVQEPSLTHRGHVCLPTFVKKIAATQKARWAKFRQAKQAALSIKSAKNVHGSQSKVVG